MKLPLEVIWTLRWKVARLQWPLEIKRQLHFLGIPPRVRSLRSTWFIGDWFDPETNVLCTWSESKGFAGRFPKALADNPYLRRHPGESRGQVLKMPGFRLSPD